MDVVIWLIAFSCSICALIQAYWFYQWMMKCDEGTEEMRTIAGAVRDGANAYLRQQYRVVFLVFIAIAILLAVAAYGFNLQSKFVPVAFLTGGFFSGLSGWLGMKTATQASSRTAQAARTSLNQGLRVAFRSGAVLGLTVVGLGLAYITIWFALLYWVWPMFAGADQSLSLEAISVAMLCFTMGASAQALFARVGGGYLLRPPTLVPIWSAKWNRVWPRTLHEIQRRSLTTWETMLAMWREWGLTSMSLIAVRY